MIVYIVKIVTKGNKNTRWQFADGYGSLFDGLLPTAGNYRVGQELDKDAFSSIREVNNGQHCIVGYNAVQSQAAELNSVNREVVNNYVDVVTGQTAQMTESEFEAAMEMEF